MRTGKRRRIGSIIAFVSLIVMIGVPSWLTWREVQRAKASAALIAAIERHDTPAALAALDAGADANAREGEKPASFSQVLREFWSHLRGQKPTTTKPTALLLATPHVTAEGNLVEWEDTRLIKALLKHGANINTRDNNDMTALEWAIGIGDIEVVKVLLEHGADANARNNLGMTPLIFATSFGQVESMKTLLEHGAYVNARDKNGMTALMWAATYEDVERVRVLLEHGADVHIKDSGGDTAMTWPIRNQNAKIVALLKKAGAK